MSSGISVESGQRLYSKYYGNSIPLGTSEINKHIKLGGDGSLKNKILVASPENGVHARTLLRNLYRALESCIWEDIAQAAGRKGSQKRKEIVELLRSDEKLAREMAHYARAKCVAVIKQANLLSRLLNEAGWESLINRKNRDIVEKKRYASLNSTYFSDLYI